MSAVRTGLSLRCSFRACVRYIQPPTVPSTENLMNHTSPTPSSDKKKPERVPRAKKVLGWGSRFARILKRLDLSNAEVARRVGYSASQVGEWMSTDTMPSAATLRALLKTAATWDLDRALSWLADGEGRAPRWLEDVTLDPKMPPPEIPGNGPPRPSVAMPQAALGAARALEAHEAARVALETAPSVLPVWKARVALEETREAAANARAALNADHLDGSQGVSLRPAARHFRVLARRAKSA